MRDCLLFRRLLLPESTVPHTHRKVLCEIDIRYALEGLKLVLTFETQSFLRQFSKRKHWIMKTTLKFIYSEKATNIFEIFTLLLTGTT